MKRALLMLAVVLSVLDPLAAGQHAPAAVCGQGRSIPVEQTKWDTIYRGEYCNYDYAYRVLLPIGVAGHGSLAPNPNHGFGVLPAAPNSTRGINAEKEFPYLYVDASYVDEATLDANVDRQLGWAEEEGFNLVSKSTGLLGGLRSIRVVTQKGDRVAISVMAYRPKLVVVYTIELLTSSDRRAADETLLDKLVAGFRLQPAPKP